MEPADDETETFVYPVPSDAFITKEPSMTTTASIGPTQDRSLQEKEYLTSPSDGHRPTDNPNIYNTNVAFPNTNGGGPSYAAVVSKENSTPSGGAISETSTGTGAQGVTAMASNSNLRSTSEALVKKLLQLDSPRLDPKIVDVLLLEGIMEIVISHVTRLRPDPSDDISPDVIGYVPVEFSDSLSTLPTIEQLELSQHLRDFTDIMAMKRSYHAMEILCGNAPASVRIIQEKFFVIISHLFQIFTATSHGNLYHFAKILEALLRRHPVAVIDFVICQENTTRLVDYMLPYLREPAVMSCMLSLLFWPTLQHEARMKRSEAFERLAHGKWLERIIGLLNFKEIPSVVLAASEFIVRMVEEAARTEDSGILFRILEDAESGNVIVSGLVELISSGTDVQRTAATLVLNAFLVKSHAPPFRSLMGANIYSDLPTPVSPLMKISHTVQQQLISHLGKLCDILVSDAYKHRDSSSRNELKFSSYVIVRPFTTVKLAHLEIIYEVMKDNNEDASNVDLLNSIPRAFWRMLVKYFFELRSNNQFHSLFYKIFCVALKSGHIETSKNLIKRTELISNMIEHYENRSTGGRGYILLILNQIRLTGDAQSPQGYIRTILTSHQRWKEFLPILRQDTLRQTRHIDRWTIGGCKRPTPYFGPNSRVPEDTGSMISPYGAILRLHGNAAPIGTGTRELSPEEETGIELGSKYAFCLGFDPVSEIPKSPVNISDSTTISSTSMPSLPVVPSGPITPMTDIASNKSMPNQDNQPKKKKHKKKKKKNKGSSVTDMSINGPVIDGSNSGKEAERRGDTNATNSPDG